MTTLDVLTNDAIAREQESEKRHLTATIAALRQALEDAEAERNAMRQSVRAAYEGEIAELKATITALRDALEETRHEGRAAVERAVARSADEITQLRQTAAALRDAIEERVKTTAKRSNASTPLPTTKAHSCIPRSAILREQLEDAAFRAQTQKQEALAAAHEGDRGTQGDLQSAPPRTRSRSGQCVMTADGETSHRIATPSAATRDDRRRPRRGFTAPWWQAPAAQERQRSAGCCPADIGHGNAR